MADSESDTILNRLDTLRTDVDRLRADLDFALALLGLPRHEPRSAGKPPKPSDIAVARQLRTLKAAAPTSKPKEKEVAGKASKAQKKRLGRGEAPQKIL